MPDMADPICIHGVHDGDVCSACALEERAAETRKASADAEAKRQQALRAALISDLLAYLAKRQDAEAFELRGRLLGTVL